MHPSFSRRAALVLTAASMAAAVLSPHAPAAPVPLQNFQIDAGETSVSGLSSGGFMAVQFSVAYSSTVKGAGVVAGGPYYCARGDVRTATSKCSCTGFSFPGFSSCRVAPGGTGVSELIAITEQDARRGAIDPTAGLARQRIWLFSGARDSVVPTAVMDDLHTYYRHFVEHASIRYRNDIPSEHAMPTDSFGNACATLDKPFINNCAFDAAGDLLRWIYGSELERKKPGTLSGRVIEFDQREFVKDHDPVEYGMANSGFLYVPAACEDGTGEPCKLHVAFHGCQQSVADIGDAFVRHAGYNPWADANRILVLYPQTVPKPRTNPKACWNWFDFDRNDPGYATRNGVQMMAVKAMADRIAGMTKASASMPIAAPRCFTANNVEHILAGRAQNRFFFAIAKGSGDFMGLNNVFTTTTLRQEGSAFYTLGQCP